ncbi:hypothetical protein I79_012237 [Cricetulus griseus]|uniref:Uncharacterized protein n=1 Tax=Cricetulus griseus TaxID=10029 RepID=G3HNA0_CRIGR|nr:hypothetical protein I79_012237 [Cricetulus griseus]
MWVQVSSEAKSDHRSPRESTLSATEPGLQPDFVVLSFAPSWFLQVYGYLNTLEFSNSSPSS